MNAAVQTTVSLMTRIVGALGVLATNPLWSKDTAKVQAILGLGGLALQEFGMFDADRQVLLEQIEAANAEGRLLTDEEMESWTNRHIAAKAIIEGWKRPS